MPSCSSLIRHHWQTMEAKTANTRLKEAFQVWQWQSFVEKNSVPLATDQPSPPYLQTRMVPSRPAVKIVPRRPQNTDSPKRVLLISSAFGNSTLLTNHRGAARWIILHGQGRQLLCLFAVIYVISGIGCPRRPLDMDRNGIREWKNVSSFMYVCVSW